MSKCEVCDLCGTLISGTGNISMTFGGKLDICRNCLPRPIADLRIAAGNRRDRNRADLEEAESEDL